MLSDGTCGDPSGSSSCTLYRECDPVTGAVHFEYTLPSGVVKQANMWTVNPDGTGMIWLGPDGTPATPPAGLVKPTTAEITSGAPLPQWTNLSEPWIPGTAVPPAKTTTPPATTTTPASTQNVAPDWFSTLQSQLSKLSASVANTAAPPANASGSGTSGSTTDKSAANSSTSGGTIIPGVPDMYLYLGAAAAALLLLMGKK
jgi:hypothetical protein